ncbi:MAG: Na/Pi symporter [Planctomycetota bacterium]
MGFLSEWGGTNHQSGCPGMSSPKLLDRLPLWVKVLLVFGCLYFFLVGIGSMSAAFKMMGKDYTKDLLGAGAGPLVSLFTGILATVLVQSSSTTTSIIVGLVAAGGIEFEAAVFMVMGANVGTTVTNTIVSLGHIRRSTEYRRAFAAATVHDFFNLIVLLILFPLEVYTGILSKGAIFATEVFQGAGGLKVANPIKAVSKPTIELLKDVCEWFGGGGTMLAIVGVALTFLMLVMLVKVLRSIMITKLENLFDRILFKSPYRALVIGFLLTVLVQSSSITTSVAIPLVGAGVLTIQQVLPYTMGANVGTTITALLAALAALAAADSGDPDAYQLGLMGVRVAFFHVLFNIVGVAMLWPVRWLPVKIATSFARMTQWNRLIPLVYIVVTFYLIPFLVVLLGR